MLVPKLIYLDTSSFLTLLLGQEGGGPVRSTLRNAEEAGATLVSSRLLWLEAQRVTVREGLVGNDIRAAVAQHLAPIEQMPLTDDVWVRAAGIEQHVKTLDALHLATCELLGAELLAASLDSGIARVAAARGVLLLSGA